MDVQRRRTEGGSMRKKRKYLIRAVTNSRASEVVGAREASSEDLEAEAVRRFAKSRHELIAEIAYYKAEHRGFRGGDPDRDWLEAEVEVEELLRKGRPF